MLSSTTQISKTASEVMEGHQSKLIRQYSTVSQLMEDTFISSLMLLDESGIRTLSKRIESASECDLDCSSFLLELDGLLGPVDGEYTRSLYHRDCLLFRGPFVFKSKNHIWTPVSISHGI